MPLCRLGTLVLGLAAAPWASAQPAQAIEKPALSEALAQQVQQLAGQGARAGVPTQARVEIQLGELDPRLRLAPCQQVEPYLPNGQRMWGRTRVGLRCTQGPTRWNVTLPLTVRVFARAQVLNTPLPAGGVLSQADLHEAEIDIAADGGTVFTEAKTLVGRTLVRNLNAGEAVRSSHLKQRQWFAAGDSVKVLAIGQGYAVEGEGQALNPGTEGQDVRIRFESGRVVTGKATGERKVEVQL
jgi:flagella basal body P-ring formation protein FlgA